jgi:hypothetical protein
VVDKDEEEDEDDKDDNADLSDLDGSCNGVPAEACSTEAGDSIEEGCPSTAIYFSFSFPSSITEE